jgi:hypothetical protein
MNIQAPKIKAFQTSHKNKATISLKSPLMILIKHYYFIQTLVPGQCSQYSDWLRAGQPRGQSSSPGRGKNFPFSTLSSPTLGPTQPLLQWVQGSLSMQIKWSLCEANNPP